MMSFEENSIRVRSDIGRTPVRTKPYGVAIRIQDYQRLPVIHGRPSKHLSELIVNVNTTNEDIESSLKLSQLDSTLDPIWGKADNTLIQLSCSYFASEILSGPPDKPYEGRFLVGWHHEEWDRLINESNRVLVKAARDSGKSHWASLAYPIWKAGIKNPGSLGYIFSATQPLAESLLSLLKQELLQNSKLEHFLPEERDRDWSKKEIYLRNGSITRARGMGVKIRGGHPQWIVVDDGLTDEDIYSETIRKRTIDYFLSAITNMIVPGGQILVFGTIMHLKDLYAYLDQTGEYASKTYPAISKEGKALFPERYTKKHLEKRKNELGPARFAREFLCVALSDDASLFPSTLFEGGEIRLPYCLGLPAEYWEEKGMQRFTGVDFAMSSSSQADFTVIFTVAVDKFGNRWIANIRRGKGWGFQRQLDEIKEEYALLRPEIIHAEANQMQRIFTDEIIRTTDLPIRKFFTAGVQPKQPWRKGMSSITMGKHSLERGLPSIRIELENKKWRIPRGDRHSIELTDIWMGELQSLSFQNGRVISVGEHDDSCMSCAVPETIVATTRGLIQITEVKEGDLVMTHNRSWRRVEKNMNREYDGEIVVLKAEGLPQVGLTPEHPMLVKDRYSKLNMWRFVRAGNIESEIDTLYAPMDRSEPVVERVSREKYKGMVYNLEVEKDHTYTVNGAVSHNCWMADTAVRMGGFNFSFGEDDDLTTNKQISIPDQNSGAELLENSQPNDYATNAEDWKPKLGSPRGTDFGGGF
jgi:hypothetical protein